MNFTDVGIVLDARAHGETHAVVDVFTQSHGRWAGLVYGGQGKRMRPLLQAGNEVTLEWKGRGEDSLGHFSLEMSHARAGEAMGERLSLAALSAACAVALATLPEREAHARAYTAMAVLLANLDDIEVWPALMARWELGLLAELGFGLTLDRCAATGARENLVYVSPRSACAVSAEAGEPYKDKLLPLPAFLRGASSEASPKEAIDALATTGHFIETRILHLSDKQLPEARMRIVELLKGRL
ncbi:DNA repair protein RecO [Hyphococcus luteus]|uniref:DNA repair protein RecO n=1 Tax=Hyphococcus luteus TaxID=2058213 RepID=A0A2S7K1V1_9PROT|nr:DNA repair protein RecO [Marinicaulis flavus]PQA86441.1 DNA repair protein RecO [Marinicaulis flavus]